MNAPPGSNQLDTLLGTLGVRAGSPSARAFLHGAHDFVAESLELVEKSGTVADAIELHEVLSVWIMRLEHVLARAGAKVTASKRRHHSPGTCDHKLVDIDETASQLSCRDCGVMVNAIWWLSRHTEAVERAEGWRRALELEKHELAESIDALKRERANHKAAVKRHKAKGDAPKKKVRPKGP